MIVLSVIILFGCASSTVIKTMPSGAKVKKDGEIIGTTPYEFWDREHSDYTATYVLSKHGYKDKEVTIKKDVLFVHRIIVPPIIGLPWLYGYNPSYFYELEKSGEQTAQQTSFGTQPPLKSSNVSEYSQKLRELNNMKNEGLITDEEYERKKQQIIDGM